LVKVQFSELRRHLRGEPTLSALGGRLERRGVRSRLMPARCCCATWWSLSGWCRWPIPAWRWSGVLGACPMGSSWRRSRRAWRWVLGAWTTWRWRGRTLRRKPCADSRKHERRSQTIEQLKILEPLTDPTAHGEQW